MLYKKKVAVVIPNYKEKMTELERISLNQVMHVLGNYDIFFVLPKMLFEFENYPSIKKLYFDNYYFQSISSYNKFMMTVDFYSCFQNYEYILIYQLDAFVFRDNLLYFCELGYDYIGAPWLYGINWYFERYRKVYMVGNGGFSLRKVRKFIEIIHDKRNLYDKSDIKNEDVFFSSCDSEYFKVAPVNIALKFAFECEVKRCFEENNKQLPFGCHAWEKYDLDFWKPYIEQFGFVIADKFFQDGKYDEINKEDYEYKRKWTKILKNPKIVEIVNHVLNSLLSQKTENIFLWGAGNFGIIVVKFLKYVQIPIKGFVDSSLMKTEGELEGFKIYNTKYLMNKKKINIIISTSKLYEQEIKEKLEDIGYCYKKNFILWSDIFETLSKLA